MNLSRVYLACDAVEWNENTGDGMRGTNVVWKEREEDFEVKRIGCGGWA